MSETLWHSFPRNLSAKSIYSYGILLVGSRRRGIIVVARHEEVNVIVVIVIVVVVIMVENSWIFACDESILGKCESFVCLCILQLHNSLCIRCFNP